jgi:hypothetical protein
MRRPKGAVLEAEFSEERALLKDVIEYTSRLTADPWSYTGPLVLSKGGRRLASVGTTTWDEHKGECRLSSSEDLLRFSAFGKYGRVLPEDQNVRIESEDGTWYSTRAFLRSYSRQGNDSSATFDLQDLVTGDPSAAVTSHGIVIGGAALEFYPHRFPFADSERESYDGLLTTIFGRAALARKMPTSTASGHDVFVGLDGEALETVEQGVLCKILSFFSGRDGAACANVGLHGAREVWKKRYTWSAPTIRARSPIRVVHLDAAFLRRFPMMLATGASLYKEGIRFDVALSHLFADSRGHIDVELRDITLALDALVESDAFKPIGEDERFVITRNRYSEIVERLRPRIEEVLESSSVPERLAERILERLKGANDVSHGERRRKFWRRVGFDLKSDEKEALDNRHPMSHQGFLNTSGTENVERILFQARLSRNLVNRAILALLGYDGPVFDFTAGTVQPWSYFLERTP